MKSARLVHLVILLLMCIGEANGGTGSELSFDYSGVQEDGLLVEVASISPLTAFRETLSPAAFDEFIKAHGSDLAIVLRDASAKRFLNRLGKVRFRLAAGHAPEVRYRIAVRVAGQPERTLYVSVAGELSRDGSRWRSSNAGWLQNALRAAVEHAD